MPRRASPPCCRSSRTASTPSERGPHRSSRPPPSVAGRRWSARGDRALPVRLGTAGPDGRQRLLAMPPESLVVDEAFPTGAQVRGFHHDPGLGATSSPAPGRAGACPPLSECPSPAAGSPSCASSATARLRTAAGAVDRAHEGLLVVFAVVNNRRITSRRTTSGGQGDSVRTDWYVGIDLVDPDIDYVSLALSMGASATLVEERSNDGRRREVRPRHRTPTSSRSPRPPRNRAGVPQPPPPGVRTRRTSRDLQAKGALAGRRSARSSSPRGAASSRPGPLAHRRPVPRAGRARRIATFPCAPSTSRSRPRRRPRATVGSAPGPETQPADPQRVGPL